MQSNSPYKEDWRKNMFMVLSVWQMDRQMGRQILPNEHIYTDGQTIISLTFWRACFPAWRTVWRSCMRAADSSGRRSQEWGPGRRRRGRAPPCSAVRQTGAWTATTGPADTTCPYIISVLKSNKINVYFYCRSTIIRELEKFGISMQHRCFLVDAVYDHYLISFWRASR